MQISHVSAISTHNTGKKSNILSQINYFDYMSQPGNYGTITELLAATEIFGFIGYVIQSINDDEYSCYDFGLSNNPLLNENKPVVYLLFTGPGDKGHFRLLIPNTLDSPQIHTGSYRRTLSEESNLISIRNASVTPTSNIVDKPKEIEHDVLLCKFCPKEKEKNFATKTPYSHFKNALTRMEGSENIYTGTQINFE